MLYCPNFFWNVLQVWMTGKDVYLQMTWSWPDKTWNILCSYCLQWNTSQSKFRNHYFLFLFAFSILSQIFLIWGCILTSWSYDSLAFFILLAYIIWRNTQLLWLRNVIMLVNLLLQLPLQNHSLLSTWTQMAIVNELGLGWTRVDLDILDAEIFQSTDESMSCVI